MDKNYYRITKLIELYLEDEISPEEMEELLVFQKKYPEIQQWIDHKEVRLSDIHDRLDHYISEDIFLDWEKVDATFSSRKRRTIPWMWTAAASIAVIISLAVLFQGKQNEKIHQSVATHQDSIAVKPGSKLAYLTLSNGQVVTLGNKKQRTIQVGNWKVNVINHVLDYKNGSEKESQIQKLEIPKGGTYRVKLSDGTKVWLNAQSELIFPSTFTGDQRIVKVKGEAFFKVAQDPHRPFKVQVKGTTIEVLGTSFNVNTHVGENMVKTILTQGKIKVSTPEASRIIKPGYATLSNHGQIVVEKANIEEALAWKDGYFYFNGKNLKEILGEVSRWYDVDLDIKTSIGNETYKGGIKRTEGIDAVCHILEYLTGYQLKTKDKILIVNK